ncbi:MAG: ABC transporter permease [Bacteroidetes bacterium]|nr:MAG: ABC transporter permease [Bacteroidota bacterium]
MLRNYLLVALRNLYRNRISSLVNILGLAIGMAAFVLIIQYVRYEINYDSFHEHEEVIYRIQQDRFNQGEITTQWAAGCSAVGQALYENFEEVENFTRFQKMNGVMTYGEIKFREEEMYMADTSFFDIFSFKVLKGDGHSSLENPMMMMLSESTARKYFGDEDPVGKSLRFNGGLELEVSGVYEDAPRNSHLKPDILVSWETLVRFRGPEVNAAWQWDGFFNYIQLHPETDPLAFEAKLPPFVEEQTGEAMARYGDGMEFHLQPLRSIHLHSDFMFEAEPGGNARSVYALIVVAVFLVVIAWVNFINMSGARSLERAREVGMRKVTGAFRSQVLVQFLFESVLINLLAILLAVLMVLLFHPSFNLLTGEQLDYSMGANASFWAVMLSIFVAGAFLSGIYPALFLSSFKPTTVFQGVSELKVGGLGMRRILVIFQFATSLLLIAGTLSVYLQISFMRNSDLGVDIENVLVLKGPSVNDSTYSETFSAFKKEVLRNPDFEMVSASIVVPGRQPNWNAGGIRKLSDGDDKSNQYRVMGFDFDFVNFYGLEIIEGRNFSRDFGQNSSTVLFNEAAIELMGFEDNASAMNVPIYFWGDTFNIVGVLKNFHQEGLHREYEPLIFRFFEDPNGYYSLKVNAQKTREALTFAAEQWQLFFPLNPFEYFFLEDYYNEQYKNEVQFGRVFGLFAFLAIFIACLGLFGLSSYTTLQRRSEIGLRKVLGSSSGKAVVLLLRYFMIQVLIAVPIGLGLGYYIMHNWLQNFSYRVGIGWWFFLIPLLLVSLITLITVGGQVVRTANVNPADSLRHE